MELGSLPSHEDDTRDDLNFSWDNLPDKFMREEYELRADSRSMSVSEETKVRKLCVKIIEFYNHNLIIICSNDFIGKT